MIYPIGFFEKNMHSIAKNILIASLLGLCAGCVSSALEPSQFRAVGASNDTTVQTDTIVQYDSNDNLEPQPLTSFDEPGANQSVNTRAEGLEIIRAKASQPTNKRTSMGSIPNTATSQLSTEEQARIKLQLAQSGQASQSQTPDSELEAKQASMRALQRKAKSHYDDALNNIEN